uniref:Uncharacterized protein n=1 Tax=Trypanosoma congolense (strain IL3000) TaxID=1068625 RepID=G0UZR1_TRYCI|nr:conserved hypothetical protein [Trypanosoma congolense IL3000]
MKTFTLISMLGDRVSVPCDSSFTCQSLWLQAACDIGEEEGIVPTASAGTLQGLVEYMSHIARRVADGVTDVPVVLPISCAAVGSGSGFGYDVRSILPDFDVDFLNRFGGMGAMWNVEEQRKLMELMVTADFIGHGRLSRACAAYMSCRIMSATESDILGWFVGSLSREIGFVADDDGAGDDDTAPERVLSDAERLRVLEQMKKFIEVDD